MDRMQGLHNRGAQRGPFSETKFYSLEYMYFGNCVLVAVNCFFISFTLKLFLQVSTKSNITVSSSDFCCL